MKQLIAQEQIMELLEKCYSGVISGLPGSKSCQTLAAEYLNRYSDSNVAAKKLIDNQVAKCKTSGFVTSLGDLFG